MKTMMVRRHGPPDVLELCETPRPAPGPEEVVVENHVIGVNFVDTQHRAGLYYPVALPLIPGTEAAGVVAAVGAQVDGFRVGDRVAYAGYMAGVYAEYAAVPQERLVPVPAALPLEQAAAGLLQGLTADVLAHQAYPLQPGDSALVHAAAGGVGALLVQMAAQRGAVVIGTTSSTDKAALVRRAGAQHVIVHTQEDLEEAALRLTDQRGVCVVYDGVGGALFAPSLNVLRARGSLITYGQAGGPPPPLDVARLSGLTGTRNRGSLCVRWVVIEEYLETAAQRRAGAATVFEAILTGGLRLHIADAFPLEEAAHAHRLLESGATSGKLLLQVA
jgi:NADPH2:quinone reductase